METRPMADDRHELLAMRDIVDGLLLSTDDVSLGRVADIEVTIDDDGAAYLSAILVGPEALAGRVSSRLRPLARWIFRGRFDHRVSIDEIGAIGPVLNLRRSAGSYALGSADAWVLRHILRFIPGSGR